MRVALILLVVALGPVVPLLAHAEPTIIKPPGQNPPAGPPPSPPPSNPPPQAPAAEAPPADDSTAPAGEKTDPGIAARSSKGAIGPGFVWREPMNDIAPGIGLAIRASQHVSAFVAISAVMEMVIYDFEGIGDAYVWLFDKDEPQIAGAIFLMWFIPFWFSHTYMGVSATVFTSETEPSFYVDLGMGFASVLLQDRCYYPGWGAAGAIGYKFSPDFSLEISTFMSSSFSDNGGLSLSSMLTIGFHGD